MTRASHRGSPARWLVAGVLLFGVAAPAAAQPTGDLRVVVFSGETPAASLAVEAGGARQVTDADGTAVFTLPAGRHAVRLGRVEAGEVEVVAGAEVEVVATLDASGAVVRFDVESPKPGARGSPRPEGEAAADGPRGRVEGQIVAGGEPVSGARVFARGATGEAVSGALGDFGLELAAGEHDLVVIHPGYLTARRTISVAAGETATVRFELEKATPQLEDFVVTAPHIEGGIAALVAERRDGSDVSDVIGAEEMSRSGDSDAAGALKRVTGITVVGGRFVYVRGMGERYSSTLLNGQAIPSPEPERRVIPLDLFSTDVLESVVIQKTPSPDSPGELGGGIVRLRTRSFPAKLTAGVSLSTGLVSNATFKDRPRYHGGSLDFLGLDDGGRDLPAEIRSASPIREGNQFQDGFSREELAAFGRLLPDNYAVTEEPIPMNRSVGATLGDRRTIFGIPAGFLLSGSYRDEYGFTSEQYRRFVASDAVEGGLQLNNDFLIRELERTVGSSGIVVLGVEPAPGHRVQSTTMVLRVTNDETAQVTGRSDDLGRDIRRSRLRFAEQQLVTEQLSGEHPIERLGGKLAWRYAFSRASRDEPDRREYFYIDESVDPDDGMPDFQISGRPAGNQRIWSELVDRIHDAGIDYTQPLELPGDRGLELQLGANAVLRHRELETIRLTLRAPRMLSPEERRLDPETVWSPENINAENGWILEDTTQPTDAYSADQLLEAGYLMATTPLAPSLEIMAGARVERSRQRVSTFAPFSDEGIPLESELDDTDILPSATIKWQLGDSLIVRGGYGRTVTRPDFRELSESQYRDVLTATRFVGNPDLERGTIDNFDARLEYYLSTDESLSLGAFYKTFTKPIEQVDLGGVDRAVSWDNAAGASNLGLELEARKRLGFVAAPLDPAFVAVNLALIRSQVDLGPDGQRASTSAERPLQGQSPYVVNAQLGYDDSAGSGASGVLLLNVFGRRIRDVGRLGTPDIFEEPFYQLDFVYRQRIRRGLKLQLKASNLLDRDLELTQGDQVARRYRKGRALSVGLSWSY